MAADRRVTYGPDPLHFGDLRVPVGQGPYAVVIVIHGGFWRAQWSLDHASHECAALTAAGFATWCPEYRRVGNRGGGWPGTFDDMRQASSHLAALAAEYPLHLERVLAVGHSAGGHLALWLATQALPFTLRGVMSLAGVTDLRRAVELNLGNGAVQDLLGEAAVDKYPEASPFERLPLGIPQVLIHGEDDAAVPIELSQRYYDAAVAAGDSITLRRLPKTGHFEVIDPLSAAWPLVLQEVQRLSRA